ncbi:hypothetical protein QFC20_003851 [Naganishia adeliensis]|uniref:Uncharacterized protein n=1 Tax=Naganishia adeliensis TaxID=92952 RepID=A0ACC2W7B8_9TREE|nr:hypothetical protein QFC20_003851 [Naganishia adeliensis]
MTQETQCISPERLLIELTPELSPITDDHGDDIAELEISEHWVTEREGEGANEEFAIVFKDDDEQEEEQAEDRNEDTGGVGEVGHADVSNANNQGVESYTSTCSLLHYRPTRHPMTTPITYH